MDPAKFLAEIGVVCVAALVGGLLARRVGQPVVLGYLVAGVLVGPATPGYVANTAVVDTIAEWGVVLLLFAVGVEFSLGALAEIGRAGLASGLLQVGLTVPLGFGIGRALGFPVTGSVVLGLAVAMSSTMVVLKILDERGENDSFHGKTMLAILIVQDLLAVVFAAVIPGLRGIALPELPAALLRGSLALLYLAGAVFVAIKLLPWVFGVIARVRSRELFVLGVIAISFGAAVGAQTLGFSLALGAFVAGLAVSGTEFSHLILAEVKPFRDLFAAVFFVSIGMLARPALLASAPGAVALLVGAVVLGKLLLVLLLLLALRLPPRVAVMAGLGLAQIGEFSFVLVRVGLGSGVITKGLYELTVLTAVITLFVTPLLLRLAPGLTAWTTALVGRGRAPLPDTTETTNTRGHVIVCGHGRVGGRIRRALTRGGLDFVIVDYDVNAVRAARQQGIPAVYGDASNPEILRAAGAEQASLALLTVPDAVAAALAAEHLRRANPALTILARAHSEQDVARLSSAGANVVVWPELEAGVEMVRQLGVRTGLDPEVLAAAARGEGS